MTQNNTQSVRIEAETATTATTCRIPTFEEVYEMPYVQESIASIIEQDIQKYPLLAPFKEDIRQELLIQLNNALPKYDGRAGLKTYIRSCLENGIKYAHRQYFRERHLQIALSNDISDFEDPDENTERVKSEDVRAFVSQCRNSIEDDMRDADLMDAINALPEPERTIAFGLLNGESVRKIERRLGLSNSSVARYYAKNIRKAISEQLF